MIDGRSTLVGRRVFFEPEDFGPGLRHASFKYKGQQCYVIAGPKGGTYDIRFEDGFECDAYPSELYL